MQFIEAVAGGKWLVRVIRAGLSANNNLYPAAVLREALALFDGARVFNKSDSEHLGSELAGKSFDKLIGSLSEPKFIKGADPDSGEVQAFLTLIEPEGEVGIKLQKAYERGMAGLFGFSINAVAHGRTEVREGRKVRLATRFARVNSVDLIVEPGSGGELIRFVEAVDPPLESQMKLREIVLMQIKEAAPAVYAGIDVETISDDDLMAKFDEAVAVQRQALAEQVAAAAKPAAGAADEGAAVQLREALAGVQLAQSMMTAQSMIGACGLPQPAKDRILARFAEAKTPFSADEVESAIEAERTYLARFTESGKPLIHFDDVQVGDRRQTVDAMLDAFFNSAHKDHRSVQSFKECYIEITGDRRVTGDVQACDSSRLREAAGRDFREAVSSSTFSNVLGAALHRQMIAEYNAAVEYDSWQRIATTSPIADFRTNERTRFGGYGDLPAVAENAAYTAATTPGDEKATYAISKRGYTETISIEAIANDDVGAIRRIPQKMGRAAKRTLAKFVFDFLRTNPTIYDTLALFHATHNNLFTTALDAAQLAIHRLAMLKQAELTSADRLGVTPRTLVVPPDLVETANNLFNRNTNNDKTFIQSMTMDIVSPWYWTDANDWCTVADPRDIPTIEVGFWNGDQEPQILVQDMPTVGSLFSNDQITYRIRHVYGGNVLDFRGMTKAVVP